MGADSGWRVSILEFRNGDVVVLCGQEQQRVVEAVLGRRVAFGERPRLHERLLWSPRQDPSAPQALGEFAAHRLGRRSRAPSPRSTSAAEKLRTAAAGSSARRAAKPCKRRAATEIGERHCQPVGELAGAE